MVTCKLVERSCNFQGLNVTFFINFGQLLSKFLSIIALKNVFELNELIFLAKVLILVSYGGQMYIMYSVCLCSCSWVPVPQASQIFLKKPCLAPHISETIELHPVNNYYANEKIIDISNSIDAIEIRIKQHELYIMV